MRSSEEISTNEQTLIVIMTYDYVDCQTTTMMMIAGDQLKQSTGTEKLEPE